MVSIIAGFMVKLYRLILYALDNKEKLFGNIGICMTVWFMPYLYVVLKSKNGHK